MDTLRGHFDASGFDDDGRDDFPGEDDTGIESPPIGIGTDERRMQVRAYNFWASQLQDRNFPAIEDLEPDQLPDFGPYSVLLDFSAGIENPAVQYLGRELARECGTDNAISNLSDVPARSLLSRITDHYLQIIANQAPIGFEAEFVNQRGSTILYRGILLPFSSDDDTIDFIYGVINWKEMADQMTTDELLLEIDQALEEADDGGLNSQAGQEYAAVPVTDWADAPGAVVADLPLSDFDDSDFDDDYDGDLLPQPLFGMDVEALLEDEDDEDAAEEDVAESRFASLLGASPRPSGAYDPDADEDEWAAEPLELDVEIDLDLGAEFGIEFDTQPAAEVENAAEEDDLSGYGHSAGPFEEPFGVAAPDDAIIETVPEARVAIPADRSVELAADAADAAEDGPTGLYDCLAAARELAHAARSSEDRSRAALYEAVGRAYDVSLAAIDEPEEFADLVSENGLTVQDRAPMTPVVKLVFGADYDKTRLTEYSAVLAHAHRSGIERGGLTSFLRRAEGGLKGIVQAERRLRREEAGKPCEANDSPRDALATKLRAMDPRGFGDIAEEGNEFALVMIRRLDSGEIIVLGEVPDDVSLVERAARRLLG